MNLHKIVLFTKSVILLSTSLFARELTIAEIPEEPNRWKCFGLDVDIIEYIMKKIGVPYKIILEESNARMEKTDWNEEPQYLMPT